MKVYLYQALSGEILHHTDGELDGIGGWGKLLGFTEIPLTTIGLQEEEGETTLLPEPQQGS